MLFPGRIYIARGPWYFGDFPNIFQPNVGEDRKWAVLCDKFGSGYCITFIKKLDEGLR